MGYANGCDNFTSFSTLLLLDLKNRFLMAVLNIKFILYKVWKLSYCSAIT